MKFLILSLLLPLTTLAAGKIIDADIAPSGTANISLNKLAASTANNVCTFNGSGFIGAGVAPGANGNVLQSNGTNWTSVANTAALSLGAFGSSPNANGLTLSSNVLNMQPADGSNPGGISTTTQTIAGAKTFASAVQIPNGNTTTPGIFTPTGGGNTGFYFGANGASFGYNGTEVASFVSSVWKFNVPVQIAFSSSPGSPSMTLGSDANTGFYRIALNEWGWSSNSVKILDMSGTGLAVTGTLSATGAVTLSNYGAGIGRFSVGGLISSSELSGDVTTSGSNATTISAGAVTNAKMANMANNTVKGNVSGAPAAPSDLSATQLNSVVALADLNLSNAFTVQQTTDSSTGNVTALSTANTTSIRLTGAAPVVQGIANGSLGRVLTLHNATGSTITVSNQNAGPVAANRILTGTGADMSLVADASLLLMYDNTTTRWRVVGGPGGITALTGDVTASGQGSVAATIANGAVTNAKMANMAGHTYKGNNTGSAAAPADITNTQLTADLNLFTSTLQGLVPSSGGGTTTFLRADGSFATPPGTFTSPLTTKGDIYGRSTVDARIPVGTNGQIMMADSTQTLGLRYMTEQLNNLVLADTAANNWVPDKIDNHNAEGSLGDWAAYSGATLTGGAPNTTCTRNTTSPINGTADFLMTVNSGATRLNEGCSLLINIPTAYRGKPIRVIFPYITTGTIASGDYVVTAYDVTNSVALSASTTVSAISGTAGNVYATFSAQTSAAQLRIGLNIARSSTGAATVEFDDFRVEPDVNQANIPVSDWQAYTPTGSWNTNVTYTGQWHRIGDSIEVQYKIALSGAPNATNLTVTLPSTCTIDTTKLVSTSGGNRLGIGGGLHAGGGYETEVFYNSTTDVAVEYYASTSTAVTAQVNATAPVTWANTDAIFGTFRAPCSGWSSGGGTSPVLSLVDWTPFTPTGAWNTNTTYTGWWRRIGDSMSIIYKLALTGAPNAATLTLNLPSNYTIDTTKLPTTPTSLLFPGNVFGAGAGNGFRGSVFYKTTTSLQPFYTSDGTNTSVMTEATITQAAPYTFANADYIYVMVEGIPIQGWTSTSSGTLTAPRSEVTVDTGNGYGATNTKMRRFTNTRKNIGPAITYADSSTNGATFTINEAGVYAVTYNDYNTGGTCQIAISVNDSAGTTNAGATTYAQGIRKGVNTPAANGTNEASWTGNLSVNDIVYAKGDGSCNSVDASSSLTIVKVSQ